MGAQVYCLDASACSLLSEDWGPGTTRFHFQRELIACQSRACLSDSGRRRFLELPHGARGGEQQQQVVLITSSGGKAAVALHPSPEAAALQQALAGVRPDGEANLEAALKLALLVSRCFPPGSTHVTAFVASSGAAAGLCADHPTAAAAELQQRYSAAGITLDVAILCPREELGAGGAEALEALTGGGSSSSSSSSSEHAGGTGMDAAPASRLVWLAPVEAAVESWQQVEPALELLEGQRRGGTSERGRSRGLGAAGALGRATAALPQRISRAPRAFDPLRHPRAPLLALRSGVQQPALCRGESLSRLGHLSSDGMVRPWLPTYSSLGQQARAAAAGGGDAGGGGAGADAAAGMVYVEVQPIPKWRTLLKVAAGRMLAAGSGSSWYATASSELLHSLDALSVLEEEEEEGEQRGASSSGSSDTGGSGEAASRRASGEGGAAAGSRAAAVQYRPDARRGTLRLLQAPKEPELLKLVWSPDPEAAPGVPAPAGQQQPLDMFGEGAAAGGGSSAAHAALLGYMPASAVAASAARGPLVHEGCELWETAAEWDWELPLPTQPAAAVGGVAAALAGAATAPPAAVEARQLPNGAQVVLVTPAARQGRHRPPRPAAAFWLQQGLGPTSLQLPAYGTASSSPAAPPPPPPAADAPSAPPPASACPEQRQDEEAAEQAQQAGCAAEKLAGALLSLLRGPPAVDLRRLRRDVKSGAIQVTTITVGPLPAAFVRDIVATRSAMMGSTDVENLDSWGDGSSVEERRADGGSSGVSSAAAGSNAERQPGGSGQPEEAAAAGEGGDAAGGAAAGASAAASAAAAAAMQQHRSAVLSLLRRRLHRPQTGGKAGGAGPKLADSQPAAAAAEPPAADGAPDASADGSAGQPTAKGPASPAAAIPCTPPPTAHPAGGNTIDSCGSSAADTPFGTPMHILPSRLLHHRGGGGTGDEAGTAGVDQAAAEAADGGHGGLPGAGVKHDGPAVLVGAGGQGEGGEGEPSMFQLE